RRRRDRIVHHRREGHRPRGRDLASHRADPRRDRGERVEVPQARFEVNPCYEFRITNAEGMTKPEIRKSGLNLSFSAYGNSDFIRASAFVIKSDNFMKRILISTVPSVA